MKKKILSLSLALVLLLTGCSTPQGNAGGNNEGIGGGSSGKDDSSFGDDLSDLGAYDGFFEEETVAGDMTITCLSGSTNCYSLDGKTLTFSGITEDTVYSIQGKFNGNIVIDVNETYKFDLEMHGFSMVSDEINPITVYGGNEVSIKAKKDTENYIYDTRTEIDESNDSLYSGAIYSMVDLEMSGKGKLTVVSENNNGIHSKKDLQVKNLILTVSCKNNALKGNDSVSLENATATLIASEGDGIKTTNTDVSGKGNQRGTVSINGGSYEIYASCDGIDAAYDTVIDGDETSVNIYTDKYSNYSEDVTKVDTSIYYIRFTSKSYSYSVKYYNSDSDYLWVNAEYHSSRTSGNTTYYFYSFPRHNEYSSMQFFVYSSGMNQGQEEQYAAKTDYLSHNDGADTFALTSRWNSISYEWTDYSSLPSSNMGPGGRPGGGMNEGNSDKGDHSTKGIKAGNEIVVNAGTLSVKSYDDAFHASSDSTLENGETPTGSIKINGGVISLYSNDDGIHADGDLFINGGSISVLNSYEGVEGNSVTVSGGNLSIYSKDDGINCTLKTGTAITLSGGKIFVYAGGDGIDSNSQTSGSGIVFSGADVVVISTSGGNSAIDTERGYTFSGGSVIAIMPRNAMTQESTNCSNFSSIGKTANLSLTKGEYVTASIGSTTVIVRMPTTLSSYIVLLGSSSASISNSTTSSYNLEEGQVLWK